jgi:hypothetical protein
VVYVPSESAGFLESCGTWSLDNKVVLISLLQKLGDHALEKVFFMIFLLYVTNTCISCNLYTSDFTDFTISHNIFTVLDILHLILGKFLNTEKKRFPLLLKIQVPFRFSEKTWFFRFIYFFFIFQVIFFNLIETELFYCSAKHRSVYSILIFF